MNSKLQMSHYRRVVVLSWQADGQTDRRHTHRQAAVTVFVMSMSDRQWESVILACDSLVRPSCHSEAFQHTRAGSSDKPVLLNNTTERQAENTPCCTDRLIGGTTWAEGTNAREGRQGRDNCY